MTDDLTLVIGDRILSGWTDIRVTRGIERCPSDFEIHMTELNPAEAQAIIVQAGDACQVMLGDDLVVTGYVDAFTPSIAASNHSIRVMGRGRCQDLVDCCAEWPGGQIVGNTVLGIARKLGSVYEPPIQVSEAVGAEVGPPIPQMSLNHLDTPWTIIERICRYRALLPYEGTDGNLLLAASPGQTSTDVAASGFAEGVNVQAASADFRMDQRYSEYFGYRMDIDPLLETGDAGNLFATLEDTTVRRHRRKVIIAETTGAGDGFDVSKRRVQWELAARLGRSYVLHLTTDSWRDNSGALWEPNTLVPLTLPSLKINQQHWLICEVTYKRDSINGTTADLVIKPPEAFQVEPITFYPLAPDVGLAFSNQPPQ